MRKTTIRHQNIEELIGTPPSWLTRWGITIIIVIIFVLLIGACLFSYPERISSPIVITYENPPICLFAHDNGQFDSIYLENKDKVIKDQLIAVIKNPASTKDMYQLKKDMDTILIYIESQSIDSIINFPKHIRVGELTEPYIQFLKSIDSYILFKKNTSLRHTKEQNIQMKYYDEMIISYNSLYSKLLDWERKYVFKSPVNGQVIFVDYWSKNRYLTLEDKAFTIIPDDLGRVMGKCFVQTAGIGKIKEGQLVTIKLNEYPYMEFGMLTGYVKNITLMKTNESYVNFQSRYAMVEIIFDDINLSTTYNKSIDLSDELTGVAEISIKKMSLMEHLLNPLKHLWNNVN